MYRVIKITQPGMVELLTYADDSYNYACNFMAKAIREAEHNEAITGVFWLEKHSEKIKIENTALFCRPDDLDQDLMADEVHSITDYDYEDDDYYN